MDQVQEETKGAFVIPVVSAGFDAWFSCFQTVKCKYGLLKLYLSARSDCSIKLSARFLTKVRCLNIVIRATGIQQDKTFSNSHLSRMESLLYIST
jgi:hypothetical protein